MGGSTLGLYKLSNDKFRSDVLDPIGTAKDLVTKLGREVSLQKAFLFGSGARNRLTPDSDLDILVVLNDLSQGKVAYKIVGQKNFSPIAVDWIFKDIESFEIRKNLGGVCFEAFHHGIKIYG